MKLSRMIFSLSLIALLFTMTIACTLGGAAYSGAQMVYDRHSLQKKLDDGYTSLKAYNEIYIKDKDNKNTNVSVATFNDIVLITGQVPNSEQSTKIVSLVKNVAGPRKVLNYLEIASPASFLTHISDACITTSIKAKLIASSLEASSIKVVTENGAVYLLGTVSHEQADVATQLAKSTTGVQKVIRIFSYVYISQV